MQKQTKLNPSLFDKLTSAEVAQLKKYSQEKEYDKGEIIFSKGEPGKDVWVVKKGRVHLQNISYDGKVITSCIMTSGDIFCCLPALDGKPYTSDALVVESAIVLKIPGEFFRGLVSKNPAFSQEMMCTFCDRLRESEDRGCHALDPAEFRIIRLLLTLGKKFNNEIPLTRQEMAEIAGLTVETTIRILSRMKKDGLIRSVRRKTCLVSPEKLEALVKET